MKRGSLFDLVCEGAARVPRSKPALLTATGSLSYGALLDGARGIAATLREAGVPPGARVGLCLEKGPGAVQALLGALAAGCAYVPLDPRSPPARCAAIARNCELAALVVDVPHLQHLPTLLEGLSPRIVLVDGAEPSQLALARENPFLPPLLPLQAAAQHPPAALPELRPEQVAYLLYTSGSTGTPKGVVHTHGSGIAFTRWVQRTFRTGPQDVFSSHAPLHFDLSISDLFAALGSGASVRLFSSVEAMLPPHLVRTVRQLGITVWYSVPSVLTQMMEAGGLEQGGLPSVRVLLFAGEVFPTPQLRRLRRAVPHAQLWNLFGPTETNVCTAYQVPEELPPGDAPIPIGHTCTGLESFVLDDEGREIRDDREGTLWVRGPHLMQGYWADPARTHATLQPDPRGVPGLAYCTGDRVRREPDGAFRFHGRRDHQVKTRGFRVELGEIEAALAAHPEVLEAVAVPLPDPQLGNRIVASVLLRTGGQVEPQALRAFCAERLPAYMVPERIAVHGELPRTSTSKADRTALKKAWETGAGA
ncbi:D-alanine--poly(phosphoribitol) ligase [Aggregicoccus sp. 17bor-14]|uniref:amino acid adenylation domain-containing protein n=1 Tax=Myxococcaceae TaxID=31 RepID=UPI00129C9EE2|nr:MULTISPECIES: amino acid adenylation domain-containing protein [Myxococcaceae]MBF5043130.1 amino acid adenylation domain-containing protein [Simulacricoccus sp. 17bor-14]MRI88890.1 D-alanine--poly(phosphoribitol) ligase [Aggregicoccus sp. 17bor-14]